MGVGSRGLFASDLPMTYKIPRYTNSKESRVDEYKTMIAAVGDRNIFTVEKAEDGIFMLQEACDQYYELAITHEQLRALGEELIALANTNSEPRES